MAPVMELSRGPESLQPIKSGTNPIIVPSHQYSDAILFEYTWSDIKFREINGEIRSSQFAPDIRGGLRWSLRLYPRGIKPGSKYASIFLCHEPLVESEIKAKFSFTLKNPTIYWKIKSPKMKHYSVFKYEKQFCYGYEEFCTPFHGTEYQLKCKIEVRSNDGITVDQGEPLSIPDSRLHDDMFSAFTMGKYTDFTISNGEVSFPVHKVILAARSSVFASMFEYDTKEQQENRVDITDTTPEALKEMLRFIYSDEVMGIETVAYDLLAASEKYALDKLKVVCEEALRGMLAVDNAAEILMHADLHRADDLKARAIDFINTQMPEVLDTPSFKSMTTSHPHLLVDILRKSATRENQNEDP